METCLLNYFILNEELKSTCDFNPDLLNQGRGIYEVFRVIDGVPLFLEEHLERFYQSVKLGRFDFNLPSHTLKRRFKVLLESNGLKTGNIQFHLIEHPKLGNLFISWISPHRYPSSEEYSNGVEMSSLHAVRHNPHLKSTNLPARNLANELISTKQVYEVLLVDEQDRITEGSRSNFFLIREEKIYTPSLSMVLEGITRSAVVKIVLQNRIELHNTVIPFTSLSDYEAAFLTSTSMKVLPVRNVDDHPFDPGNSLMRKLMHLFDRRIQEDLDAFGW